MPHAHAPSLPSPPRLFCGVSTALVTPMSNGAIDFAAFERLVEWQIAEGIHGLVVAGTTAESASLSVAERDQLLQLALSTAAGRVPIIAGTGDSDTATAIALTQSAERLGASAALVVTPAYNKPSQAGLVLHIQAIHDATNLPILLYDVPSRTALQMAVETVGQLAKLPRVVGIKDANDNLARPLQLRNATDAHFLLLSGNDQTALAFLAQGGDGWISVTSNVAPRLCVQLYGYWRALTTTGGADVWPLLRDLNLKLLPLSDALFLESNPAPVKHALSLMGRCADEFRLPLTPVQPANAAKIRQALQQLVPDLRA